jgi:hypothetical protein
MYQVMDAAGMSSKDFHAEALGAALTTLGANYTNCADDIAKFNSAVAEGDKKTIEVAANNLELSVLAGEAAAAYNLNADALHAYAAQV